MMQQAQTQRALAQQAMQQQYQQALAQKNHQQGLAGLYNNTPTASTTWVALSSGTNGTAYTTTSATTSTVTVPTWFPASSGVGYPPEAVFDDPNTPPRYVIRDGRPIALSLPDGTVIDVKADGSFTINDKDAKVTYRANRVRDFNSYINASDKLEAFIKFCGEAGVMQDEMLDIPVKHFIAWLIVEAAKADGEAEPATAIPALPSPQTRCRCGRFISRKLTARKIAFCRPVCLERELEAA